MFKTLSSARVNLVRTQSFKRTRRGELCVKLIPLQFLLLIVGCLLISSPASAQEDDSVERSSEEIIRSYVADFRSDRFASNPIEFGIEVESIGSWHVVVKGEKAGDEWRVDLENGKPSTPTFIYKIEPETLRAIDRGELNPLTAQGKAFSGDYTPMSVAYMDGFAPTLEQNAAINPFSFHFWTRGFPEVIPFGRELTREAHGGQFVAFYYETGLRTAWTSIAPGGRVRDDPREQAMPFPMLIIGIEGVAEGEVDGTAVSLPAGKAVFIPANSTHIWWNDTEEPTSAILIMFGKGA